MDNKRSPVFTLLTVLFIFILTSAVVGSLIVRNRRAKPTHAGHAIRLCQHFGTASWYGHEDYPKGSLMANGEEFDDEKFTCASWDWDFGTMLRVVSLYSNKEIVVEVTDRGPAKYLVENEGRIIDLSKAAFAKIADLEQGLTEVQIEAIEVISGDE